MLYWYKRNCDNSKFYVFIDCNISIDINDVILCHRPSLEFVVISLNGEYINQTIYREQVSTETQYWDSVLRLSTPFPDKSGVFIRFIIRKRNQSGDGGMTSSWTEAW